MDTVTVPKEEFEMMKNELETLRNSKIYKRFIEYNIDIPVQRTDPYE